MVAVCLGGNRLADLCRCLCADYKQFSSGAPDLLMVNAVAVCNLCGEPCFGAGMKSSEADATESDGIEFPWEAVLGEKIGGKAWVDEWRVDGEGDILRHDWGEGEIVRGRHRGGRGWRGRRGGRGKEKEREGEREGKENDVGEEESMAGEGEGVVDVGGEEGDILDLVSKVEEGEGEGEEEEMKASDSRPSYDPFLCTSPDIVLPPPPSSAHHSCPSSACPSSTILPPPSVYQWKYSCVLVEVKGPTDRLSDEQQRWIHVCNSIGIESVVCRVKEGGMGGIAGGYHRTASREEG
jgi:hypothetical protein